MMRNIPFTQCWCATDLWSSHHLFLISLSFHKVSKIPQTLILDTKLSTEVPSVGGMLSFSKPTCLGWGWGWGWGERVAEFLILLQLGLGLTLQYQALFTQVGPIERRRNEVGGWVLILTGLGVVGWKEGACIRGEKKAMWLITLLAWREQDYICEFCCLHHQTVAREEGGHGLHDQPATFAWNWNWFGRRCIIWQVSHVVN